MRDFKPTNVASQHGIIRILVFLTSNNDREINVKPLSNQVLSGHESHFLF